MSHVMSELGKTQSCTVADQLHCRLSRLNHPFSPPGHAQRTHRFMRMRADMERLQHKCNRLRLLATCSITITNKQNPSVIDYDYIVSNHDYNHDYICLETSSERKQIHLHSSMEYIFRQHTI